MEFKCVPYYIIQYNQCDHIYTHTHMSIGRECDQDIEPQIQNILDNALSGEI